MNTYAEFRSHLRSCGWEDSGADCWAAPGPTAGTRVILRWVTPDGYNSALLAQAARDILAAVGLT